MNFPRYKFAKETEPELLKFLQVAQECKLTNTNCDLNEHKVWQKLLPFDATLIKKLDDLTATDKIPVIELSSDDEQVNTDVADSKNTDEVQNEFVNALNKSTISDVAFVIKENLETQQNLSESAKENLVNCLPNELEELFAILGETLTNEETFYFGTYLHNFSSIINEKFCRYLLVPRLKIEHCDNLLALINQYSLNHFPTLKEELLSKFNELNEAETKIFLQYLNNLNLDYQSELLRDFIFRIESLTDSHLLLVENLMNSQVEYETLNKLVEMLSNVAEEQSQNKSFGKLLMNTIKFLGPNLMLLEQPLKHIIAGHKSVWRSKLEKTFSTCYEDSLMFTQSFRD